MEPIRQASDISMGAVSDGQLDREANELIAEVDGNAERLLDGLATGPVRLQPHKT